MRAIQQQEFGGPEVLRLVEIDEPVPGPGEVLVDVTTAGVNFADTHQRRNEYLAASELPLVPGAEVAGVRRDTGERVVALTGGRGGYAEVAAVPAAHAFPIPDGRRRRRRARAAAPGAHGVASAAHERAASRRGRASSCTRRPAAPGRSPSSWPARSRAPGA